MKVEIVSHCYAKEQPHWAACLNYQLSSIVLDPPKTAEVLVTVCCSSDDERTLEVLAHFRDRLRLTQVIDRPENVWRRCVLRNWAAKRTRADIVWFTDVDHCFYDGVLDRLAGMEWPTSWEQICYTDGTPSRSEQMINASMIYPKKIMIHRDWETGDEDLAKVLMPCFANLQYHRFKPMPYNNAIGGVQIVRGDFAREHGYLDGDTKWQQPASKPFPDFRDDVVYRGFCRRHGPIMGVDLPGVYRIRHGRTSYQPDKTAEDNERERAKG